MTLEEFLRLPEIDDQPYQEFIDGRVEAKPLPSGKHSCIEGRLVAHLEAFAEPLRLGGAFVELRCNFAGRSLVPDVVFLCAHKIEVDEEGEILDETLHPPDIHVEIVSPDQSVKRNRERLLFSTAHGCPLGWLIDPERKRVEVYRR
jgi:Uma2 family endonuclease